MYHIISVFLCLSLLSTLGCKSVQHLSSVQTQNIRTDQTIPKDASIESIIKPYRTEMAAEMDEVLGHLEEDLVKGRPNSNMGNWFCDILYDEANKMFFEEVDFALQNYGGLRLSSLPKGPLTKGEIFQLMPFDNTLVVLVMEGKVMKRLLDALASKGGWPISKGLSFKISGDKATDIMIQDKPFDINSSYRVAVPDYVANGGDQASFLKTLPQEESGVFIREILIAHLGDLKEAGLPITIDSRQRITK